MVVIFEVGGQSYGLGLEAVREILPLPQLSQPPGLPPVLAGFFDLGGEATAVVRLARLFGVAELEPTFSTPLLLVRWTGLPLALLVDCVREIAMLSEQAMTALGENVCFNACAQGLARVGETGVVLLCEQRLFREQELRRFGELTAIEQLRLSQLQEAAS
jgi:purine-binding chemotaxis protein CheW